MTYLMWLIMQDDCITERNEWTTIFLIDVVRSLIETQVDYAIGL